MKCTSPLKTGQISSLSFSSYTDCGQHSAGGHGAPTVHLTLCRHLWLRLKKGQCWAVAGLPYSVMEGKDRSESREPGSCPDRTEKKEKELILFCPRSLLAASFPAATRTDWVVSRDVHLFSGGWERK